MALQGTFFGIWQNAHLFVLLFGYLGDMALIIARSLSYWKRNV